MCTVTIIGLERDPANGSAGGIRMLASRDEERSRQPATPPTWHTADGVKGLWPTDPTGGGTWVAVSERGLALTLLNGNPRPYPELPPPDVMRSRGTIIPQLIGSATPDEAIERLGHLELDAYVPFRLVAAGVVDGVPLVANAAWDRASLRVTLAANPPVCFASSGMGDELVQPRYPLFDDIVGRNPTPEAQDEYHKHTWPDRLPISVWMMREAARTVSMTCVEVLGDGSSDGEPAEVSLHYEPMPEPYDEVEYPETHLSVVPEDARSR